MAEVVATIRNRYQRHTTARLKRRRDDRFIAWTALVAAMVALPLAQNNWHCPEVAAVLAVSATAMLAGQRWAIALVVLAELLLAPTVVPRAFLAGDELVTRITGLVAVGALVPGLLAMKRAAAAMVLLAGWQRTQRTCRRFHIGLIASAALAAIVPFI